MGGIMCKVHKSKWVKQQMLCVCMAAAESK